ncbi:MAG: amidase, partial [Acidobacteria bacterium]|nr:amidase [Acidobacteriota bacterium]
MKKRAAQRREARINRRSFLRLGALGGLSAAAATSPILARVVENHVRPASASTPDVDSFELDEMSIADLRAAITKGRLSARSVAQKYLERIEEIDRRGPSVNSVIEINPDALKIAEALDRELKGHGPRGPLHGVPLLIKDNIDTADRMLTTAGSLALVGAKPLRDAFVVERLREAGAVILGKTNLSEWANFRSTHSTSGWSGRGGQTRNPYALDRNPCGSSSGSGAAVAANLCAAAIGTETDGSIVCPASSNGIVGIKPTLGLVSRSGIIPISHSQDTAGPMARTVADAAALLTALASTYDTRDPSTLGNIKRNLSTNYTQFLDASGLRGARLGVARKFFGFSDKVDALMNDAIDMMKRSGAVVIDPADIPSHGKFDDSEYEVLLYEFKADLNKYLAALVSGSHPRTLKALIEFNEKNKDREMPYFGQEIFVKAEAKGPLTERAYLAALRKNHLLSRAQGIDAVMARHKLDA